MERQGGVPTVFKYNKAQNIQKHNLLFYKNIHILVQNCLKKKGSLYYLFIFLISEKTEWNPDTNKKKLSKHIKETFWKKTYFLNWFIF